MFRKSLTVLFVPVFFFIGNSFAFGASPSISPSGNGVYIVQGSAMDGVSAIELTITYDRTSLSSPSVSQGSLISGALMAANTRNAGSIRIAIANPNPLSGSGPLLVISFANKGTGSVLVGSVNMVNDSGAAVSQQGSSGFISTPGIPFSESSTSNTTSTATTNTSSFAANTSNTSASASQVLGTVSIQSDSQPKSEPKPAEISAMEQPQQTSAVAEPAAEAAKPTAIEKPAELVVNTEVKQTVYGSVLERFRTFQGKKAPATMTALFAKPVAQSIRQEPAIVISDGKTNVRIVADLSASAGSSPNFALNGARMVSLKRGDVSGRWILEALPNINSMNASVTILNGNSLIEYPLTTVLSGVKVAAEEPSFSDFLKDAGTKVSKRDLNGDGLHNYMDDYIYTAVYLIRKGAGQISKK